VKRCPNCGCVLATAAKLRRARIVARNARRTKRWQAEHRAAYNEYQKNYQRKLRRRLREAETENPDEMGTSALK
jgi:hypothetical protein